MSKSDPLVTPEIRRHIIAMAMARKRNVEIAAAIGNGIAASYVAQIVTRARAEGIAIPYANKAFEVRAPLVRVPQPAPPIKTAANVELRLVVDEGARDYLMRAALRRGRSLEHILSAILTAIYQDNMIDAVLDDGPDLSQSRRVNQKP